MDVLSLLSIPDDSYAIPILTAVFLWWICIQIQNDIIRQQEWFQDLYLPTQRGKRARRLLLLCRILAFPAVLWMICLMRPREPQTDRDSWR
jgi:hypothetical protein